MKIGSNPSSIKLDPFSAAPKSPGSVSPTACEPTIASSEIEPTAAKPSYALPANLPSALRHLDDEQLDRLLAAVIAERQGRRGKMVSPPEKPSRKPRIKAEVAPLPQGKLNAVRAAFKAGVTPNRIAKQFGISPSDLRGALAR